MEDYTLVKTILMKSPSLKDPKWNHNDCYYKQLINLARELGYRSRYLAAQRKAFLHDGTKMPKGHCRGRAEKMIEKAKSCIRKKTSVSMRKYPRNAFRKRKLDVIITSATAHHLPYEWLLNFAKEKLRKGGKLIVLDLAEAKSLTDHILWGSAFFPNILMNLLINGRLKKDDEHTRRIWERHGKHDVYMTLDEIKRLVKKHIPTARVRRKLFWRYLLVWQK